MPVALLTNPELFAAVGQARAQVDLAAAERDRVYAGVREEQVESLRREVLKAQAAQTLAHQQLDRIAVLAVRSDASLQERDEARDEAARADADVRVAQARFAEAQLGPTAEERALADAQLHAAEAARDVVEARAAKMLLRAPAAGEIGLIVPEVGEAVVPGETVLTLLPDGGVWFGFNLREDALGGLAIGAQVPVAAQGRRRRPDAWWRCATGVNSPRGEPPARAATTTSTRSFYVSTRRSRRVPLRRGKLCGCNCQHTRKGVVENETNFVPRATKGLPTVLATSATSGCLSSLAPNRPIRIREELRSPKNVSEERTLGWRAVATGISKSGLESQTERASRRVSSSTDAA